SRAQRVALLLLRAKSSTRFAALAPPHPPALHLLPQAGEGLLPRPTAATSRSALVMRSGRRSSPSGPCHSVRNQPFSCEAGEGGAQRRMRARAQRAALALPGPKSKTRFAALAPPHPPSAHLLPQAGEER